MNTAEAYIAKLESYLRGFVNPAEAGPISDYMRGQFHFLGIRSPERKTVVRQFFMEHGLPGKHAVEAVMKGLWNLPEREFQYAALAVLEKIRKHAGPEMIDLLEWMIVNKSWWDTVDDLAANHAGGHFTLYPNLIEAYTTKWMDSGNIWLQRSALLYQLKYKKKTDTDRLFAYIRRLSASREFFIAKAIGWSLREYSKTDEEAIRRFVAKTPLAPLSVREALKHVDRKLQRSV